MAQARLIAAAIGPKERPAKEGEFGRTGIDLFNSSNEPVYRLVVGVAFIQGTGPKTLEGMLESGKDRVGSSRPATTLSILPPGRFRTWIPGVSWSSVLSGRSGAEIAFTDRAGSHWIRRAMGDLEELTMNPFEHFKQSGLFGPYELGSPERLD